MFSNFFQKRGGGGIIVHWTAGAVHLQSLCGIYISESIAHMNFDVSSLDSNCTCSDIIGSLHQLSFVCVYLITSPCQSSERLVFHPGNSSSDISRVHGQGVHGRSFLPRLPVPQECLSGQCLGLRGTCLYTSVWAGRPHYNTNPFASHSRFKPRGHYGQKAVVYLLYFQLHFVLFGCTYYLYVI